MNVAAAIFEWALMTGDTVVQLFQSEAEANKAWKLLRKRKARVSEFHVAKVRGLFDGE